MKIMILFLLSTIFLILSAIHFNWALGGKWAFDNAVPSKENGEKLFVPSKAASAVVGFGLLLFALFYGMQTGFFSPELPDWIIKYVGWIIPIIFLLRAMGDFKYVGFFKRKKQTAFARLDQQLYSPLCLCLGILGMILNSLDYSL